MEAIGVRRFAEGDRADWELLWAGYNSFYERGVEQRVTDRLWSRLVANAGEPFGFAAVLEGRVVGLAHYFFVSSTSDWTSRCYLQDLFAAPELRGRGIGRKLIEAVYAEADGHEAAQVYWLTQDFNAPARRLYDQVARATPFIKYQR